MRRLQYCLQWLQVSNFLTPLTWKELKCGRLQYATNHIDAQILILRDFMASLQVASAHSGEAVSHYHMRTLNDVKRDVVDTIRQVVDIISKYAGGALPEPARQRVRGFILHLPQRWANASRQAPEPAQPYPAGMGKRRTGRYAYGTAEGSSASNPYPAPSLSRPGSPTHSRNTSVSRSAVHHTRNTPAITGSPTMASHGMSTIAATQAAQRILTLATESLDMIRGVTGVFKESLDRADAYVSTLFYYCHVLALIDKFPDGSNGSKSLVFRGKTQTLSLQSPTLALHRGHLQTLTQSLRRLRFCLPEGLHVYLPFTSPGPLRASTPPTLLHHLKRHPLPRKWVCSQSLPPSPHHAVLWAFFPWMRARILMVQTWVRRKSTKLKFGHDQSHQLKWTLMDDDNPHGFLFCGFD